MANLKELVECTNICEIEDIPAHIPIAEPANDLTYSNSLTLLKTDSGICIRSVFTFHEDCVQDIEAGKMTIQETMVFPINRSCLGHHIRDQALHICLWRQVKL